MTETHEYEECVDVLLAVLYFRLIHISDSLGQDGPTRCIADSSNGGWGAALMLQNIGSSFQTGSSVINGHIPPGGQA